MSRHVHKLIAETAKGVAAEWYADSARHDNAFYRANPSEDQFVRHNWGMFVEIARTVLVSMLRMNYPEHTKAEIYEALLHNHALH